MSNEQSSPEPEAESSAEPGDVKPPAPGEVSDAAGEVTDAERPAEAGGATPRKKRKKKKKDEAAAAAAEPEVFERPATDARGRERPRFLLRFPRDPELESLIAAFEAGNYAHVRQAAPALAERAERPEVRGAAEELLERTEPDPLVKVFLAISVALLAVVAAYAYLAH